MTTQPLPRGLTTVWIIYVDGVRRCIRFSKDAALVEAEGLS